MLAFRLMPVLALCSISALHAAETQPVATEAPRRTLSIAVFTFRNLTPSREHDWIGTGFAEALTSKLAGVDRLYMRGRVEIADAVRVAGIDQRKIDAADAAEAGKLLGCDYLVFGAIQAAADVHQTDAPLRATARMVDVRTGAIGHAVQLDGRMTELFELQNRLAVAFVEQLGLPLSRMEQASIRRQGTDSLEAYRLYCQGLEALESGQYDDALRLLRMACDKHPGILYADAHHALGTAFLRSGRTVQMLQEFRRDAESVAPIWFDLGVSYLNAGQHEKAAEALATYLKYGDRRFAPWQCSVQGEWRLPAPQDGATRLVLSEVRSGELQCLDSCSGQLQWRQMIQAAALEPRLEAERLFVADAGGALLCMAVADGKLLWSCEPEATDGRLIGLAASERIVICLHENNVIRAVSAEDGRLIWRHTEDSDAREPTPPLAMTASVETGYASALLQDELLYLVDARGRVHGRRAATGESVWCREIGGAGEPARLVGVLEDLLIVEGLAAVHALSRADGSRVWQTEAANPRQTFFAQQNIIVASGSRLMCLDRAGTLRWQRAFEDPLQGALGLDDTVAIHFGGHQVLLLGLADGGSLARRYVPQPVAGMTRCGDILLLLTREGTMHAFGIHDGESSPDDRHGYLLLTEALEKSGSAEEAIRLHEFILETVDPGCMESMVALERLYRITGRAELSHAVAERMRRLGAEN